MLHLAQHLEITRPTRRSRHLQENVLPHLTETPAESEVEAAQADREVAAAATPAHPTGVRGRNSAATPDLHAPTPGPGPGREPGHAPTPATDTEAARSTREPPHPTSHHHLASQRTKTKDLL